jgi:beta-lactam-binding protein with PASTA domain
MPNVVGLEYQAAQVSLQAAGVLVLSSIGYFGVFPITPIWQPSKQPSNTVLAQSIAQGTQVAANTPISLNIAQFPVSVASP